MDLTALSESLEALTADLARARADHFSGRAERLRLVPVYGAHADLMRPEHLGPLRAAAPGDPEARALLSVLARAQIEGGCAPILDRISETLATELIRSLDDKWYFEDCEARIAREGNRKQRKVIDQSRRRVLARLEPDLQEVQHRVHTLMVDRGFAGYVEMCQELSGVDLQALFDTMDGFLEDSRPRYWGHLSADLREAGVFPDDARYHDLVYLFAGAFGPARGLPAPEAAVGETLEALGFPLDATPGLLADLGSREGKRHGAWVLPGRAPEEVHLIVTPDGTWSLLGRALEAAGTAAALAHTPPELPFARRGAVDVGAAAAWGVVFGSLFGNDEWLRLHAPKVDAEPQCRRFAVWWLTTLRHLAGSARFTRFLHGPGDIADKADAFEHTMHEATGVRIERDNYLFLTDGFLDSALAFRGHVVGTQIVEALEGRFGRGWFADPGAAAWLRAAWAHGSCALEPLAAACDIEEPGDIWPLTERLEAVLGEFTEDV